MKAFLGGIAAMIAISLAAFVVLGQVQMSAQDVFTEQAVRL